MVDEEAAGTDVGKALAQDLLQAVQPCFEARQALAEGSGLRGVELTQFLTDAACHEAGVLWRRPYVGVVAVGAVGMTLRQGLESFKQTDAAQLGRRFAQALEQRRFEAQRAHAEVGLAFADVNHLPGVGS